MEWKKGEKFWKVVTTLSVTWHYFYNTNTDEKH